MLRLLGPLLTQSLRAKTAFLGARGVSCTTRVSCRLFVSYHRNPSAFSNYKVLSSILPLPTFSAKQTNQPTKTMAFSEGLTLAAVRDELIRMEDTVVFALIERAKHPRNAPAYDAAYRGGERSLVESFVRDAEALQAKLGRYQNPEEVPFFPDGLPVPEVPAFNYPQVLNPIAATANASKAIWDMYVNDLLPLFTVEGDDGCYASTAALDLVCLQALSRRIHYGKYVAEVKFRDEMETYSISIRAKDKDALMKMLTFVKVEEMVKKRVEKKAMVFGQNVSLCEDTGGSEAKYKVEPSILSRLYGEWVMPLTKDVEVDYLLLRLD